MKPGLLYGIIFFVVFLLVTGGIYFIAGSNPGLLLLSSNKVGANAELLNSADSSSAAIPKSKRIKLIEEKPVKENYSEIDTIKGIVTKTRVEVKYDKIGRAHV